RAFGRRQFLGDGLAAHPDPAARRGDPCMSKWKTVSYDYGGAQVLVTGATSGIGAAIAAAYRDAGAQVTITGTRASAAEYECDLSGYRYMQLQLEDNAGIEQVAAALPRLDILVNNAGCAFAAQNEYEPEIFE